MSSVVRELREALDSNRTPLSDLEITKSSIRENNMGDGGEAVVSGLRLKHHPECNGVLVKFPVNNQSMVDMCCPSCCLDVENSKSSYIVEVKSVPCTQLNSDYCTVHVTNRVEILMNTPSGLMVVAYNSFLPHSVYFLPYEVTNFRSWFVPINDGKNELHIPNALLLNHCIWFNTISHQQYTQIQIQQQLQQVPQPIEEEELRQKALQAHAKRRRAVKKRSESHMHENSLRERALLAFKRRKAERYRLIQENRKK
jgi:hypothetical protein